jgi:TatA/E family protein of Tat protein translocase
MFEDLLRNPLHLMTLLVVVMLVFGGKRVSDLGASMGKGVREFRREIRADDDWASQASQAPQPAVAQAAVLPTITQALSCKDCGAVAPPGSRFCVACGQALENSSQSCPHCQASIAPHSKFCNACGRAIDRAPNGSSLITA